MKDIKKNQNNDKSKIKLIKEKPKTYATSIGNVHSVAELIHFLENNKDKRFDIIVNGKLFKITSSVARSKFAEGFKLAREVLRNINNADNKHNDISNKLNAEKNKLQSEIDKVKKDKETYCAKEAAMVVRVAAWKDRIVELEDTCQELRNIIDGIGNAKQNDI